MDKSFTEQSLTELDSKIVTLWSYAATVAYACLFAAIFGFVLVLNPQVNDGPLSPVAEGVMVAPGEAQMTSRSEDPRTTDARASMEAAMHASADRPVAPPQPLRFNNNAGISPLMGTLKTIPTRNGANPGSETLKNVAAWLSSVLGLPAIDEEPQVELVSQMQLALFRFRGLASDRQTDAVASAEQVSNIVALYDDARRTIYLNEDWTGTYAEMSVLVHEMVHHVQSVAGLKYDCPQAREQLAYEAQQRWLEILGLNLEDEFGIDPLTALTRSLCM